MAEFVARADADSLLAQQDRVLGHLCAELRRRFHEGVGGVDSVAFSTPRRTRGLMASHDKACILGV